VDDLFKGGELYRWDPTISSNSLLYVLRLDNQPPGAALSGPAIDGRGADAHIWMVDTNSGSVIKWPVTTSSVCVSNDTGVTNVIVSTATNLSDVAVDKNGNIYTCALVTASGDPAPRVFRYSLSTSLPVTNADWAVGGGDDTYGGAQRDSRSTQLELMWRSPSKAQSMPGAPTETPRFFGPQMGRWLPTWI
jgi:hypothetical protein